MASIEPIHGFMEEIKMNEIASTIEKYVNYPVFALIHQDHQVKLTEFQQTARLLSYEKELFAYVQEARFFNEKGELYLWKIENGYHFRIRLDNGSSSSDEIYDEEILLRQSTIPEGKTPDWMDLKLPTDWRKVKCIVRNYLEFDENLKQFKVVDARLVNLK
ncbi:MAG: type III-D CRISPR-associated protein Csx19 [Candidatus Helarchaeota archaeon]